VTLHDGARLAVFMPTVRGYPHAHSPWLPSCPQSVATLMHTVRGYPHAHAAHGRVMLRCSVMRHCLLSWRATVYA
jgi:hypothetical protein